MHDTCILITAQHFHPCTIRCMPTVQKSHAIRACQVPVSYLPSPCAPFTTYSFTTNHAAVSRVCARMLDKTSRNNVFGSFGSALPSSATIPDFPFPCSTYITCLPAVIIWCGCVCGYGGISGRARLLLPPDGGRFALVRPDNGSEDGGPVEQLLGRGVGLRR